MERKHGPVKLAFMQIASGGSAGLVEICMMHPLDVLKTRLQVQRGADDPSRYSSLLDGVRKMYRNEGLLSFYKGILPPILAETPKRATKFFTFEQFKAVFSGVPMLSDWMRLSLAGACCGLCEAVVVNPFEVVKVRLQTDRARFTQQITTWQMARQIARSDGLGLRGLNNGLTATLMRHGVWNMFYFGIYANLKYLLPIDATTKKPHLLPQFLLASFSGFVASVVNIPFDVAKSRIQGPQPQPGVIKYRGCFQSVALVYREEGFRALYKGLVPKLLRLAPGGGIMMVVFENVYDFLQKHL